ncbi:MAG: tRNA (adenosine(37)-N6)-threonylcarbamoyltransferase complex dimerization subunit type 1 TsaB, partial [Acidimicrobiales bacterium]
VLVEGIATLLTTAGLRVRDLDRVAVDRGPGLFTGLRVGVATANALAQAVGCQLVAVSSLELLARGAHARGARGTLVSCVDARRGEVFVQTFALADDAVRALGEPVVARPRAVAIEWATNGAPVTFTGDGVARYAADLGAVPQGVIVEQLVPPPAEGVVLGAGATVDVVRPLYLRDADAVANFTTRDGAPST